MEALCVVAHSTKRHVHKVKLVHVIQIEREVELVPLLILLSARGIQIIGNGLIDKRVGEGEGGRLIKPHSKTDWLAELLVVFGARF